MSDKTRKAIAARIKRKADLFNPPKKAIEKAAVKIETEPKST